MTNPSLEPRTTALESAMVELARVHAASERNTERSLDRLSREMAAFKDKMAVFTDEMAAFKDEMAAGALRGEQERIEERREWNRRWGELSNRFGTLVEDLVAPSLPRLARPYLGLPDDHPVELVLMRVRRRHPQDSSRMREIDALCFSPEAWVVNETRSRLSVRSVDAFVASLPELREFFPEYAARRLLGCVASLSLDPSVVAHAERCGLLVLGVGDELMEIQNSPGFVPRSF